MITLSYQGETERNNTKGLLFKAKFVGFYGVNGVGDLLNLAPVEGDNPNGVTDPYNAYNMILAEPPTMPIGVEAENIGGYYVQVTPNAVPTLFNFGLRVFAPGGTELNSNQAYAAALTGGSVTLLVFVPLQ